MQAPEGGADGERGARRRCFNAPSHPPAAAGGSIGLPRSNGGGKRGEPPPESSDVAVPFACAAMLLNRGVGAKLHMLALSWLRSAGLAMWGPPSAFSSSLRREAMRRDGSRDGDRGASPLKFVPCRLIPDADDAVVDVPVEILRSNTLAGSAGHTTTTFWFRAPSWGSGHWSGGFRCGGLPLSLFDVGKTGAFGRDFTTSSTHRKRPSTLVRLGMFDVTRWPAASTIV